MGVNGRSIGFMIRTDTLHITPEVLGLIAGIEEFKGAWRALGTLAPDRLSALRRVATIESIGSSTRIEGSKLSDREVERLLSNLQIKSFATRDEQEVAGYAELMELVFNAWQDIQLATDAGHDPHGCAQLAAMAGVLPARLVRTGAATRKESAARKTRPGNAAGTLAADRRVRTPAWSRHDWRSHQADGFGSQYPQATFPLPG